MFIYNNKKRQKTKHEWNTNQNNNNTNFNQTNMKHEIMGGCSHCTCTFIFTIILNQLKVRHCVNYPGHTSNVSISRDFFKIHKCEGNLCS